VQKWCRNGARGNDEDEEAEADEEKDERQGRAPWPCWTSPELKPRIGADKRGGAADERKGLNR